MAVERVHGGTSLIDILDRILDKGLVIDAWVRVSLVGIELITIEARVVVASVDTYLRYAQAIGLTPMASRPPSEVGRGGSSGGQNSGGPGQLLEGVTKQLGVGQGDGQGGLLGGLAGQLQGGNGGQGRGQGGGQDIGGQLQQLLDQLQQSGGGQQPNGGTAELANQLRGILDQLQSGGDGQGAAAPQAQGG